MRVCQALTGSGGWPLTIIMTPDKKPFFAGTYFPPESVPGRIGMKELLPRISELWVSRRMDLVSSADSIIAGISKGRSQSFGGIDTEQITEIAYNELAASFDFNYGGFGNQPKFPSPHNLLFLLRYWHSTKNPDALEMVDKTLEKMRMGGIWDHIGFGFHRYSTDRQWLVPHFEKMLYDQAMLLMAYSEAYLMTKNELYGQTVREMVKYLCEKLLSPEGAFYSAEDADSEGVEGKYYVWMADELKEILTEDYELLARHFNISNKGNFTEGWNPEPTGLNIPFLKIEIGKLAINAQMNEDDYLSKIDLLREKVKAVRDRRIHPSIDDKILTDWNGLMIAALSSASRYLHEPRFSDMAMKNADFIIEKMSMSDGGLYHCYRSGKPDIAGFIDDYAFVIWGLLELYEAVFDSKYLSKAIMLADYAIAHFSDSLGGGFFFSADNSEELLYRSKDLYDGAIPSGNSVMLSNLINIGKITGDRKYADLAADMIRKLSPEISAMPSGHCNFLSGLLKDRTDFKEIVIATESIEDANEMVGAINSLFIPDKFVILHKSDDEVIRLIIPQIRMQIPIHGRTTAYVCRNYSCQEPVFNKEDLINMLGRS
jgi:uncharacterized protein YyaL (SSP411 family)